MSASQLAAAASTIAVDRYGSPDAPKLLAIHGFGSMSLCWDPVIAELAEHFDLAVVDLPGFGDSPLMPADLPVDARGFAAVLGALMDSLGWASAHLLGNSLGGWISLELAVMGRAESVTALAPAGLWRSSAPLNARLPLSINRYAGRAARPALGLLHNSFVRKVALGSLFGNPLAVPPEHAIRHAQGFADNEGYHRVRRALTGQCFVDGRSLSVPVTVMFAPKDVLIKRSQSDLTKLPPHTRYESPAGWGHVPMYDDPAGVVRLVRETSGI